MVNDALLQYVLPVAQQPSRKKHVRRGSFGEERSSSEEDASETRRLADGQAKSTDPTRYCTYYGTTVLSS